MKRVLRVLPAVLAIAGISACGSGNNLATPPGAATAAATKSGGSLGPVLSTSDGGEIFGFDVDQKGGDGILASASQTDISVQTFDAATGKITKTLGVMKGAPVARGDDYVADGIFDGDVALVDFQKAGKPGQTPTKDMYHLLDPVTKERFSGRWTPPVKLFNVLQWGPNQSTTTAVLFGYQREGSDPSELLVSDVAKGTFGKVITLSPNQFSLGTQPELTQDTVHNRAVMASSPSYGAAGGPPPEITTIDLDSGKLKQFSGVQCPGSVGCGYANGIGYDSGTGVACTTTELDGGVEFYDLAKETGVHEFLPNGGGQYYAGAFVASDPVNKLFLIAQPISSTSGSGSSVQVYEEGGALLESINGFGFTSAGDSVLPVRISIDPTARTGWVNGPGPNQLQEFSY
jgi:predicted small lipoprotein YifL